MSSPADDDDSTAYMDGVDVVAKKAKMILDHVNDDEKKPKSLPRPERPYPHLALRSVLVRLLSKKDPKNACARAFCVGVIHDPSLVIDIERRFMAGRFHPELEYWNLKHPWRFTSAQKSVPMMVHYVMVTDGLAESWEPMVFGRFSITQRLRSLLTNEEWDALIYNVVFLHHFTGYEAAGALFWLNDDRTVDSVLNLRIGRVISEVMFSHHTNCWCSRMPSDEETRVRVSLPRLRRVINSQLKHGFRVTENSAALGCLMQPPFGNIVFAVIDWKKLECFEPVPYLHHLDQRIKLEDERRQRQQAMSKS